MGENSDKCEEIDDISEGSREEGTIHDFVSEKLVKVFIGHRRWIRVVFDIGFNTPLIELNNIFGL